MELHVLWCLTFSNRMPTVRTTLLSNFTVFTLCVIRPELGDRPEPYCGNYTLEIAPQGLKCKVNKGCKTQVLPWLASFSGVNLPKGSKTPNQVFWSKNYFKNGFSTNFSKTRHWNFSSSLSTWQQPRGQLPRGCSIRRSIPMQMSFLGSPVCHSTIAIGMENTSYEVSLRSTGKYSELV